MLNINKILYILSKEERRRALYLLILILCMALIDMLGVASIMPFIALLTNPETITTNNILNFLSSATGGNNGAKSFTWTPPIGATGKWICENPKVTLISHDVNDIELVFREVFET